MVIKYVLSNVQYMQLFYHTIGFILTIVSPNKRHPIFDYWARALTGPVGVVSDSTLHTSPSFLFNYRPSLFSSGLCIYSIQRHLLRMRWLARFWHSSGSTTDWYKFLQTVIFHNLCFQHTLPAITAHLDLIFWNHTTFSRSAILKGIAVFCTLYLIE